MPYLARAHTRNQAARAQAVRIGGDTSGEGYKEFQENARRATIPHDPRP